MQLSEVFAKERHDGEYAERVRLHAQHAEPVGRVEHLGLDRLAALARRCLLAAKARVEALRVRLRLDAQQQQQQC